MKTPFILFAAILLSLPAFGQKFKHFTVQHKTVAVAAKPVQAKEGVVFEIAKSDLGRLEERRTVRYTFNFTNYTNQAITISGVQAGNENGFSDYKQTVIPPGGKGWITTGFNPWARTGKFKVGYQVTFSNPEYNRTLLMQGEYTAPFGQ